MSSDRPLTAADEARLRARKPVPKMPPAYLPVAGSPLTVDEALYQRAQQAPRVLVQEFVLPIRSGKAWQVKAGEVVRISTPEGAQVGDLNIWNAHNPRERFWASRTRQLHAAHVSTYDRLWSCLPYMRPLATIVHDTLAWYGRDERGGRAHDLLGTRCDPYINAVLSSPSSSSSPAAAAAAARTTEAGAEAEADGGRYDFHCHSNLTRAVLPFGLAEADVHDVINLFQVTGLDERGRYFMNPCPAEKADCIEFLAEQDLLMALSTCPGGDLSLWGFGADSEKEMIKCCRPLKVEVFRLEDGDLLARGGWKPAQTAPYTGNHGLYIPRGEFEKK